MNCKTKKNSVSQYCHCVCTGRCLKYCMCVCLNGWYLYTTLHMCMVVYVEWVITREKVFS